MITSIVVIIIIPIAITTITTIGAEGVIRPPMSVISIVTLFLLP